MASIGRSADELLAMAIASGRTLRSAAKMAGCSERTARRRWQDQAFRRAVDTLRGEAVERAMAKLSADMVAAAIEMKKILTSGSTDQVRLSAAKSILELGTKLRTNHFLELEVKTLLNRIEEASGMQSNIGP